MIHWVKTCRYLGVYIQANRVFKCIFDNAKKSFYRAFNAIYGKVGSCASLDVVFHLINVKCVPILMYGLDACPVNVSESKSLDFTVFKIAAKVLGTVSNYILTECRSAFGLDQMSVKINRSKYRFLKRYTMSCDNIICQICYNTAIGELNALNI